MPPTDLLEVTVAAWVEALEYGRRWNQQRDTQRLRDGFTRLAGTAMQWPPPAKLLECLPAIQDTPALPRSIITDEQRLANLDRLADMAKEILK